jgi:hypothetical protein
MGPFPWELLLRLVVGTALGSIIGYGLQSRVPPAGRDRLVHVLEAQPGVRRVRIEPLG